MIKIMIAILIGFLSFGSLSALDLSPRLNASINENQVNIRILPGRNSKAIAKLQKGDKVVVTGTSRIKEKIDGFEGFWLHIESAKIPKTISQYEGGWVFSKFVQLSEKIVATTFQVKQFSPQNAAKPMSLQITHAKAPTITADVKKLKKLSNQSFYTFVWGPESEGFLYSDAPGTYAFFPQTKEIRHLSYFGYSPLVNYTSINDDFTVAFSDFGINAGPHELVIIDIVKGQEILHGKILGDIDLKPDTINICVSSNAKFDEPKLEGDSLNQAKLYLKNNPAPAIPNGKKLIIALVYEYNYKTKKSSFVKAQWVLE